MSQFARNLGLLGPSGGMGQSGMGPGHMGQGSMGQGGMAQGGNMRSGFGDGQMGLDPLTNDQPLTFNSNKGPNVQVGGDPPSVGNNFDKKGSGINDGNFSGNANFAANWQPGMIPGPMGMPAMGIPGMMPGFNSDMSGGQFGGFDANMGMGIGGMFPPPPPDMHSGRENIFLKSCTLFPPPPNAPPPTTKERPPGCRTIFVGGLPENANEAIMREVFERCGEILSYRQGRRNFCHIRFTEEMHVDNATFLSGYRMRIGDGTDSADTGRLHVDYATARDDQYEYECKQRRMAREMRHQQTIAVVRPPTPPPAVNHYSEHEAMQLNDQLKGEETFAKATSQLITWLERGDCSKRAANSFYGMIQCVNSHVRRLMNEKQQYDEELQQARTFHHQRVSGILVQFTLIEQVFNSASKQRAWDHFTKAQRKNLDLWRKQAKELRANQQEELGLAEKGEEDMDMSDNEEEKPKVKKETVADPEEEPEAKRIKMMATENELISLKEENQSMQCQIEAYKNEVEIMKVDQAKYSEEKETQIKALQHALVGMQQQLMEAKAKLRKEEEAKEAKKIADESALSTTEKKTDDIELIPSSSDIQPPGTDSITPVEVEPVVTQVVVNLRQRDALLIGFMSTFLHVHPFGASVEYIWSYLQRLDSTTTSTEIDALLNKFPQIFKQELFGVGANLEKRWKFIGFATCLGLPGGKV